uniref:Uncharacterized protein n=1 Tax=Chenopodium quinoa TaxID=63459 RepID=A0A803N4K4_CHEQI
MNLGALLMVIKANTDLVPTIYVGGDTVNVEESCEIAAKKVVYDLMKKYEIDIEDVIAIHTQMYDRCGQLYLCKKEEFERIEKGEAKVCMHDHVSVELGNKSKKIVVDFLVVLRAIFKSVDISDYCLSSVAAKQNVARKAVDISLATTCRFDVILCTLERECYLSVKERVLGIKEDLEPSRILVEQDCVTLLGKEFQVPVSIPPIFPLKKRSLRSVLADSSSVADSDCEMFP